MLTRPAEVVMPADSASGATSPNAEPASPAAPPASDHTRLIWICILWAICALGTLSLGIPFRAISTKLDLTISNRLRGRLFERLLRQSPEFYHTHDPGELNAVANQFTIEAAMSMRQIAVEAQDFHILRFHPSLRSFHRECRAGARDLCFSRYRGHVLRHPRPLGIRIAVIKCRIPSNGFAATRSAARDHVLDHRKRQRRRFGNQRSLVDERAP